MPTPTRKVYATQIAAGDSLCDRHGIDWTVASTQRALNSVFVELRDPEGLLDLPWVRRFHEDETVFVGRPA